MTNTARPTAFLDLAALPVELAQAPVRRMRKPRASRAVAKAEVSTAEQCETVAVPAVPATPQEVAYEAAVAHLHVRPADRKAWADVKAARAALGAGVIPKTSAASIRALEYFWHDQWAYYMPEQAAA